MFTLESATNPKYVNAEGTAIELQVKFAEFSESMPFGATSYDTELHGVDIYNRAKAGEFGKISSYVAPENQSQPSTIGTQSA